MVYPRHPLIDGAHNSGSESAASHNTSSKKKKRKKQPANALKPGASARKVFEHQAREEKRRQDAKSGSESPVAPTPTPKAPITPETFIYHSKKAYQRARAIFSYGYSTSISANARQEDRDVPATLRWSDVLAVLSSKPVSCHVQSMKGVAYKISRPARNGVEAGSVVLHKPHSNNPRCEREVLENIAGQLMRGFGWEKHHFVLASKKASAADGEAESEAGVEDDEVGGEVADEGADEAGNDADEEGDDAAMTGIEDWNEAATDDADDSMDITVE